MAPADTTPQPEPMSASAAAAYLGVSSKTLARWANAGLLPSTRRTLGGHRRYERAELDALTALKNRDDAA